MNSNTHTSGTDILVENLSDYERAQNIYGSGESFIFLDQNGKEVKVDRILLGDQKAIHFKITTDNNIILELQINVAGGAYITGDNLREIEGNELRELLGKIERYYQLSQEQESKSAQNLVASNTGKVQNIISNLP